MKKCLILITAGFPYGTVEPFIESELPYHADFFDKIIVFAVDADGKEPRKLPHCAESRSVSPSDKRLSRIFDVLRAVFFKTIVFEEFPEDKAEAGFSPKRRLFRRYVESRSARHFKEIQKFSGETDFSCFDEIVIYSYWFFATALTGALLKSYLSNSHRNVRLVSRGHRYDIYDYANALNYLPDRSLLLSKLDALYVCSQHGKNYLSEKYPKWAEKIRCSYLGTRDFKTGPVPDGGTFRIVTCSRVVPVKRLDRLVESLSLLKDSGINLSWTHIGDGPALSKLKAMSDRLSCFMDVTFAGNLSNSDVLELYSSSPFCVFINVSYNEGLPVSIMEAASFGIPAIATDVGGTGEIVINGITGILIPSDFECSMLSDTIKSFALMNPGDYHTFRQNARHHWEENFCAENNYRRFAEEISGGGFHAR